MKKLAIGILLVCLIPALAAAENKEDVKISSTIFFRWQNSQTSSNFDVDRAYLNFTKKLDQGASARVTLDAARINFLKFAYVELPAPLTVKLGLQQTVWIDWEDKLLDIRYISKALIDDQGIMPAADFGVALSGKLGRPAIDYLVTLMNGGGFATSESDAQKALAVRLNANLGPVVVGCFGNIESLDGNFNLSASNKQVGLGLGYKNSRLKLLGEGVIGSKNSKDISGLSVGGVIGLVGKTSVILRYDWLNPDLSAPGNDRTKLIYGLTYDWSADVKLAADVQNTSVGGNSPTSVFYLQTLVQL